MRSGQFNGKHIHKVDGKGRMSIASEFREKLKEREKLFSSESASSQDPDSTMTLILTQGMGTRHIWCFPVDVWDRKVEQINKLPNTEKVKEIRRHLIGGAQECEIDRLGRILISPSLREYAGITAGDVVVTGMGETFELWSKESYDRIVGKADQEKSVQEYAEELGI